MKALLGAAIGVLMLASCSGPAVVKDCFTTDCPARWTILTLHDGTCILLQPGVLDDPDLATPYNSQEEAVRSFNEENERRHDREDSI